MSNRKVFEMETVYNVENGEWVDTYYVDGETVDVEKWYELQDQEEYLIDEEYDKDCEDCCDCDACREAAELTDEQEEELRLIEQSLTDVLQANGCSDCTFETLLDLAYTFKEIGRADTRDLMRDVLDDME